MITIGGIEFDLKLSLLIILSTILPMLDYYDNRLTGSVLVDRVLLYLVAPLLVIVLVLRESPAGYGFRLGNWRVGLLYTVAGCAGMALILWFVARTPAMQNYYAKRTPAELPALVAQVQPNGTRDFDAQEIIDRMMIPMIIETARCLEDGIVDTANEADMGLIMGIGFPPFRGGAFKYADTLGLKAVCETADKYAHLGKLYAPTAQMRAMAESGATYY